MNQTMIDLSFVCMKKLLNTQNYFTNDVILHLINHKPFGHNTKVGGLDKQQKLLSSLSSPSTDSVPAKLLHTSPL